MTHSSVTMVVAQSFDAHAWRVAAGQEASARDKEDYLTAEEVEELREAQEPHLRLKVLRELLEKRLDKARALKDPASVKPKLPESKPDKKEKCEV